MFYHFVHTDFTGGENPEAHNCLIVLFTLILQVVKIQRRMIVLSSLDPTVNKIVGPAKHTLFTHNDIIYNV